MLKIFMSRKRGSITIFLSILLIPILAFGNLMVEIGRCQVAKQMLREASASACDSVLAAYNEDLYEVFSLLALDEKEENAAKNIYEGFVKFNSNLSLTGEYESNRLSAPYLIETGDVELESMHPLGNVDVLARQIQEYAKYRMPVDLSDSLLNLFNIDELPGKIREALEKFTNLGNIQKAANFCLNITDGLEKSFDLNLAIANLESSIAGVNGLGDVEKDLGEILKGTVDEGTGEFKKGTVEVETYEIDGRKVNYGLLLSELEKSIQDKIDYCKENQEAMEEEDDEDALEEYNEKLNEYNRDIDKKVSALITMNATIKENYKSYQEALQAAVVSWDEVLSLETSSDDYAMFAPLRSLVNNIYTASQSINHSGVAIILDNEDFLNSFDSSLIDKDSNVKDYIEADKNGKLATVEEFKKSYLGYHEVRSYLIELQAVKLVDSKVSEALNTLLKYVPIPNPSSSRHNQVISGETLNLLPSRGTHNIEAPPILGTDKAAVNGILQDVTRSVDPIYGPSIHMTSPDRRGDMDDLYSEMNDKVNSTVDAISHVIAVLVDFALFGPAVGLVLLIWHIVHNNLFDDIKTIVSNIGYFIRNFDRLASYIGDSLTESFYINYYAVEKFSDRTTNLKRISDNPAMAFSAANLEYLFAGNVKEIKNQQTVYWFIFFIRFLTNIVGLVFNTKELTFIIETFQWFALIIVPVWVYWETVIDMNALIELRDEIPLLKVEFALSPEGILKEGEGYIKNLLNQLGVNGLEDYAGFPSTGEMKDWALWGIDMIIPSWGYKDFILFLLCFMSSDTRLNRIADVIQMEIRYKEYYENITRPTFLMKNANTYLRVKTDAKLNPFLPIIPLSNANPDFSLLGLEDVRYAGY